ncbi:hypothetical protein MHYP_G00285860 [Metynnis hypsauchen]
MRHNDPAFQFKFTVQYLILSRAQPPAASSRGAPGPLCSALAFHGVRQGGWRAGRSDEGGGFVGLPRLAESPYAGRQDDLRSVGQHSVLGMNYH